MPLRIERVRGSNPPAPQMWLIGAGDGLEYLGLALPLLRKPDAVGLR